MLAGLCIFVTYDSLSHEMMDIVLFFELVKVDFRLDISGLELIMQFLCQFGHILLKTDVGIL